MKQFCSDMPFYKGNLHMHTTGSDGRYTLDEAEALYKALGYDFVNVSEHWKCTCDEHYSNGLLVLPGIELDYSLPTQTVHIVGVNTSEAIMSAAQRGHSAQRGIYDIRACGGRAILAHPAWSLNTPELISSLREISAVEIYNTFSGTPWNGDRADSTLILDIVGASGKTLPTVAADDTHFYTGEAGGSFTYVQAESLSGKDIVAALDAGRFYASQGPKLYQVEYEGDEVRVECSPASMVVFHSDANYVAERCARGYGKRQFTYKIKPGRHERFVRAIVYDADGKRAWANPIAMSAE